MKYWLKGAIIGAIASCIILVILFIIEFFSGIGCFGYSYPYTCPAEGTISYYVHEFFKKDIPNSFIILGAAIVGAIISFIWNKFLLWTWFWRRFGAKKNKIKQ